MTTHHTDCAADPELEGACGCTRRSIRAKYRDLNARGRGTEGYRLALTPDERLVWADRHPEATVTSDTFPRVPLASARLVEDRCGAMKVEFPVGTVIVDVDCTVRDGRKSPPTYRGAIVVDNPKSTLEFDTRVRHLGVKKTPIGYIHVLEIDGVRREFPS